MKRLLFLAMALFLFHTTSPYAAVVPAPANGTLDTLLAFNSPSNAIYSRDMMFYNFTYTPTGGTTPATGVAFSLIFADFGTIGMHGFNFSDNWTSGTGFTLGYTAQICNTPACLGNVIPGTHFYGADATYAPTSFPSLSTSSEVLNWTGGSTATLTGSGIASPLITLGGTGPITVTANFTRPSDDPGGSTQTSLRFYDTITPAPAPVPEPSTMLLLGSGLMGLWGIRRKLKK